MTTSSGPRQGLPRHGIYYRHPGKSPWGGSGGSTLIKRDLADGKPAKDILAQHYGCGVRQAALGIQDRG